MLCALVIKTMPPYRNCLSACVSLHTMRVWCACRGKNMRRQLLQILAISSPSSQSGCLLPLLGREHLRHTRVVYRERTGRSPSRLPSSHLFSPHSRIPLLTAQHNTSGVNHHGAAAGGNRASTARQQQRRREQQQQQQCQRQN